MNPSSITILTSSVQENPRIVLVDYSDNKEISPPASPPIFSLTAAAPLVVHDTTNIPHIPPNNNPSLPKPSLPNGIGTTFSSEESLSGWCDCFFCQITSSTHRFFDPHQLFSFSNCLTKPSLHLITASGGMCCFWYSIDLGGRWPHGYSSWRWSTKIFIKICWLCHLLLNLWL